MTVSGLRRLRVAFKFGLLVSLPVVGYLWAMTGPGVLTLAATAVCVVMALGAEGLATAAETRLAHMRATEEEEERLFQAATTARSEKIRQMDRIVETLSNQNHDLRSKLISLHGEVHRAQAELRGLGLEPLAEDGRTPAGEVTDISSLRNRR